MSWHGLVSGERMKEIEKERQGMRYSDHAEARFVWMTSKAKLLFNGAEGVLH